jgi:hypothetical protein
LPGNWLFKAALDKLIEQGAVLVIDADLVIYLLRPGIFEHLGEREDLDQPVHEVVLPDGEAPVKLGALLALDLQHGAVDGGRG